MFRFSNIMSIEQYENLKRNSGMRFEYVPNTATGKEDTRKNIYVNGQKYFLSANTEKDYFLQCETDSFCVWFRYDNGWIEAQKASYHGRTETAEKYLKKYELILYIMCSVIKYDGIVRFVR